MKNKETISLARMKQGETGIIIEIEGGHKLRGRLDVMGIREGNIVKKVSGQLMRGPVTIMVGSTHTAIGFGMAQKILVEVEGK